MINLVQVLCPARHCIFALAYDGEVLTDREAIDAAAGHLRAALEARVLEPWCGLCGSRSFSLESAPTRHATMAEAEPELRRLESAQLQARALEARLRELRAGTPTCPTCGGPLVAPGGTLACVRCRRIAEGGGGSRR